MTARLSFLPSFTLSPQGGITKQASDPSYRTYKAPVSASWEIDIFGKLLNTSRGAKAALLQSKAYEQAVRSQVIASIANMYYTLLMLDRQLEISEQTYTNWTQTLSMMKDLKEAGMTNEAAVVQTEASCYSVAASIPEIRQSIRETENALSTLLGEVPHQIERGTLAEQQMPEEVNAGVPMQLLANRPDVRQAEWALAQAFYGTNAARAAFYPSITLGGTLGWTNSLGNAIVNPAQFIVAATASITEPLFNRASNLAGLRIAKAQQEEARLAFNQTLLNAGVEVNEALVQCQTARAKSQYYDQQVASLETAARSTSLLMKHGTTTYLEVLTAQQSLLTAQMTQVSNRVTEIQGIITLYQALGGGRM